MFSVRLFFAVAGVLLVMDANQAESAVPQSTLTDNGNSTEYLEAAKKGNDDAIKILNDSLIPQYPILENTRDYLSFANIELSLLLQQKAENRLEVLAEALNWGLFGNEGTEEDCPKDETQCSKVRDLIQNAMGHIAVATVVELPEENQKKEFKNITSKVFNDDGTTKEGVTRDNIYDTVMAAWEYLEQFYTKLGIFD